MGYLGHTYYLLYDQVGSLRAVVDDVGNIIKRINYDSFGNVILDTDPSFRIPIGFAGGLYDADTGLVRFGVRDYDPSIGRWTAKDPIDFAGSSVNLYGYVQSNPVNFFDPLGLFGEGTHGLVELGTYGPTSSEFMRERDVESLKPILTVYARIAAFGIGAYVTAETGSPFIGNLTYDYLNFVIDLILHKPTDLPILGTPFVIPEAINPPPAEGSKCQ